MANAKNAPHKREMRFPAENICRFHYRFYCRNYGNTAQSLCVRCLTSSTSACRPLRRLPAPDRDRPVPENSCTKSRVPRHTPDRHRHRAHVRHDRTNCSVLPDSFRSTWSGRPVCGRSRNRSRSEYPCRSPAPHSRIPVAWGQTVSTRKTRPTEKVPWSWAFLRRSGGL